MSNDFVKSHENIEDISIQDISGSEINDLLHDDTHNYIHKPDNKMYCLTDNVKNVSVTDTSIIYASQTADKKQVTINTKKLTDTVNELKEKDTELYNEDVEIKKSIENIKNTLLPNLKTEILKSIYKIGDIITTTTDENPSFKFGGEWSRFGVNRVLLGSNLLTTGKVITHVNVTPENLTPPTSPPYNQITYVTVNFWKKTAD